MGADAQTPVGDDGAEAGVSYCRWSSDNWRSDVYAYEDVSGGFTTHVACSRYESDTPIPEMPAAWHKLPADEFMRIYEAQSEWVSAANLVPIGLPFDGESFSDETIEELRDRLIWLRGLGYLVPSATLEMIDREISEGECSA